ncbi:hypothetical protein Q4567_13860 [Aliiglaciecola sp. 2_MG-2023]|uniref:hypothetical protein n=1 Tax=unclassified Aliiglaciecola TaxID=2593648 RepID=UPI0026E25DD2|nr:MULTISPECIES: hypothetical protein [unclassified Aliiglaciecola]MDO6711815.1 hypothetical protein [Aliiglaciecola sp. 2_MG-2023]MDO6753011.1 hypothetical protein [Aliiglaciecola sp. 1_MG-2023]
MKLNYQVAIERLAADSADKKVLELLSAIKGFQISELTSLSAKQLLVIADKLEISEASLRMALSRQTKQGKLIRENGKYSLAKSRKPFVLPRFWLDMQQRSANWDGEWLLVNQLQHKFSPTIMRRLNNKADLLGFKSFPTLGWLRPNNLIDLREETLFHFHSVVEEPQFLTCCLTDIDEASIGLFTQSWPLDKLNQFYHKAYELIFSESELLETLSDKDILIRSFAIGRLVVEYLSKDPWLPEDLIDLPARTRLFEQTVEYYQKITPLWLNVMIQE